MSAFFSKVLYPAWHWLKRDGINRAVRELERNQWLSGEELAAIQARKLSALLGHAVKNVPYYRDLYRELGLKQFDLESRETLSRLPLLTKAIIRREGDRLVSSDLAGNALIPNSTSGSTGEALRFYTDRRSDAFRRAAMVRGDSWSGWRLGERMVRLWGAPMDLGKAESWRGKLHGWVTGDRFLSSFNLSAESMDAYIELMRSFEPVMLLSYPGPLEEFARHCELGGARFPSLKGIVTSAETLWPHQRELFEAVFGVKVFNRYGSRELGHVASECEMHEGLHLNVDRVVVEVIDDTGHPCAPGQLGRLVITDLDNYGMPMIRYEVGDRGAWSTRQACSCGRGLPLLHKIEGRSMDVVRTADGRAIGGTFWTLLLRSRPTIRQFQVRQDRLDGITIRYVADSELPEPERRHFLDKINEHCGTRLSVEFSRVDRIDLTGSGKQRLILSNIDVSKPATGKAEGPA